MQIARTHLVSEVCQTFFSISLLTLSAFPPCVSLTNVGLIHSQLFPVSFLQIHVFMFASDSLVKKPRASPFIKSASPKKLFHPAPASSRHPREAHNAAPRTRSAVVVRRDAAYVQRDDADLLRNAALLLSIRNTDYSASSLKTSLVLHM